MARDPLPPGRRQAALAAALRGALRHARGRRGNYSATELDEWAERLLALAAEVKVFAYFNNDWEGFAVHNTREMRKRLER